jgi:hypothetical protein
MPEPKKEVITVTIRQASQHDINKVMKARKKAEEQRIKKIIEECGCGGRCDDCERLL